MDNVIIGVISDTMKGEFMFTLYVHITPNNKKYFGITKTTVQNRWGINGSGYSNQKLFWRAIQKYGWDNIEHIILAENLSKEWACQLERDLIWKYQSNNSKYGYNIAIGGNGPFGVTRSADTREKLRQANLGHHHTEKTKEKIRKHHAHYNKGRRFHFTEEQKEILYATRRGKSPWNKGKKLTNEHKEKLSISHRGQKAWNKGIPCSNEVKKKVSEANKGRTSYWKDKSLPNATKEKISKSLIGRVWVNNGVNRTLIQKTDLQSYIDSGYKLGKKY